MIVDQNLGIYTVFGQEPEAEIKKCKILQPGMGKYGIFKLIVRS